MTPEGLKLLKKTLFGLLAFFAVLLIYRGYMALSSSQSNTSADISSSQNLSSETLAKILASEPETVTRSAKQGLIARLHSYAHNYYRSNRLKNAIDTWDTVKYLSPGDPVIDLRLKEARDSLTLLIGENIALGNVDFQYLRFQRAIHFWTRAANLADGVDAAKHEEARALIQMAERYAQ